MVFGIWCACVCWGGYWLESSSANTATYVYGGSKYRRECVSEDWKRTDRVSASGRWQASAACTCTRVSMGQHRSVWPAWVSTGQHGSPCISMGQHGSPCISMGQQATAACTCTPWGTCCQHRARERDRARTRVPTDMQGSAGTCAMDNAKTLSSNLSSFFIFSFSLPNPLSTHGHLHACHPPRAHGFQQYNPCMPPHALQ